MPRCPVSRIRQLFRAHHRLFTATAVAIVLGLLLPGTWRAATRVIIGWDAGILLYLGLCWTMMAGATPQDMRWRAGLLEEDQWIRLGLLGLTVAASVVSLLAIGILLAGIKDLPPELHVPHFSLAAATILLSWVFMHTILALQYAHHFYGAAETPGGSTAGDIAGGLEFPDNKQNPDYWDFMYFSFTIGMTAQTSDILIKSTSIRRTVLVHGILTFFFNTIVLALSINIAASIT